MIYVSHMNREMTLVKNISAIRAVTVCSLGFENSPVSLVHPSPLVQEGLIFLGSPCHPEK